MPNKKSVSGSPGLSWATTSVMSAWRLQKVESFAGAELCWLEEHPAADSHALIQSTVPPERDIRNSRVPNTSVTT